MMGMHGWRVERELLERGWYDKMMKMIVYIHDESRVARMLGR